MNSTADCVFVQVISIDSAVLRGIGETVNVTFSGITRNSNTSDAAARDWIGVWSPPLLMATTRPLRPPSTGEPLSVTRMEAAAVAL